MTIDTSKYAANPFYRHVERFRDTWLERSLKSHLPIVDLVTAYDSFCERERIRHRKIPTYLLVPELSRLGVCLGRVRLRKKGHRHVVFVTWRLTRNAKYAIRDRSSVLFEQNFIPIEDCRNDDEDGRVVPDSLLETLSIDRLDEVDAAAQRHGIRKNYLRHLVRHGRGGKRKAAHAGED